MSVTLREFVNARAFFITLHRDVNIPRSRSKRSDVERSSSSSCFTSASISIAAATRNDKRCGSVSEMSGSVARSSLMVRTACAMRVNVSATSFAGAGEQRLVFFVVFKVTDLRHEIRIAALDVRLDAISESLRASVCLNAHRETFVSR